MKFLLSLLMVISCKNALAYVPAEFQTNIDFVYQQVLQKKGFLPSSQIPKPKLSLRRQTDLNYFQQVMEKQWGFKPDFFSNAYSVDKNEIFLDDEASYYLNNQRCIDDSFAHELTHFIQVKYQKFDLNDESLEWDAVDIQNWFREKYCRF